MKKIALIIIMVIITSGLLPGVTVIFPFRIDTQNNLAHQWLGRAMSFYLQSGLDLNQITTLPDETIQALLFNNNISFNCNVTKASVMHISLATGSEYMIWGDIEPAPESKDQIQVKTLVLNLKTLKQYPIPIIRGRVDNLFEIQEKILGHVMPCLANPPRAGKVQYPKMLVKPRVYEIFIKSLLIKDIDKKLEQLKKAYELSKDIDFINFELAKCHYQLNQLEEARAALNSIPENSHWSLKKIFLSSLVHGAKNESRSAINELLGLIPEKKFMFEIYNNLGLLYFQLEDYPHSLKFYNQALEERRDPDAYLNLINLLFTMKNEEQAFQVIFEALQQFPQHEKLINLFAYSLSQAKDKETLFLVFRNYLPNLVETQNAPDIPLALKNPFEEDVFEFPASCLDQENLDEKAEQLGINEYRERVDGLLSANPFVPRYHLEMSEIFFEKKQFRQAEIYAGSAFFLNHSHETVENIIKIYKAIGNAEKTKQWEDFIQHLGAPTAKLHHRT